MNLCPGFAFLRLTPLVCLLVLGMAQPGLAEAGSASLTVSVTGVKSAKGVIRLALCPAEAGFPDCKGKVVRSAALPIVNGSAHTVLTGLAPGSYAVSVFHDANANNKLDTFMGIPKEGYGFSRNPSFKPRAPRFNEAELSVSGEIATTIKLRYLF